LSEQKKYAVIVAGGSGARMGASIPKQYLTLRNKPLLWYTLSTFLEAFDDLQIILVVGDGHLPLAKEISQSTNQPERITITTGGQTRFHSVQRGLQHVDQDSIIFVHDGARCLVSTNLIHRCFEGAVKYGNAIPAIASSDSVRVETDEGNEALDRKKVKIIQTPQTFRSEVLLAGFKQAYHDFFTDEASVVERLGTRIHLVEGERTNIKITHPIDISIAEKVLEDQRRP
jgi:2-C-methyl-D-erythritol 4-phosphate cytidylyltransferase